MDINITEMVSSSLGGITKTASKNSISSANALIAKLSKGKTVSSNEVISVLKALIGDIDNSQRKEKIASLIEDMVIFSQIDESDVAGEIEKFASYTDDQIILEKKALHLSMDNYSNKSNLFNKTSGYSGGSGKRDLDSFLT